MKACWQAAVPVWAGAKASLGGARPPSKEGREGGGPLRPPTPPRSLGRGLPLQTAKDEAICLGSALMRGG